MNNQSWSGIAIFFLTLLILQVVLAMVWKHKFELMKEKYQDLVLTRIGELKHEQN